MLAVVAAVLAWAQPALAVGAPPIAKLRVPAGYRVELVTDGVPDARAMALGRYADGQGVVYVGSGAAGKLYAVELERNRGRTVHTLLSGLTLPAGVAYRDGSVYVSAVSRILRLDRIDERLASPPAAAVVTDRLPAETHHGAKFIGFGPDQRLYVAVGAPCNICKPDARHGNLQRMNADGSGLEVVATGIRNSVGFDWNPKDGSLWFTDNGRDMLGDDLPSDELNRLERPGQDFGYPYCHQGDLADPEFGRARPCSDFTPPVVKLGAHVAALGMRFASAPGGAPGEAGSIYIAEHGSWNRSRKSGYRVVRVDFDAGGRVLPPQVFVEGWLESDASGSEVAWGRPADVLPLPDGSLLVSDDRAGAIYRIVQVPGASR